MSQLLWHLLAGTRGGANRLRILDELMRDPANAQQLADRLCVDYRTVRHHLDILIENGLLAKPGGGAYGARIFVSRWVLANRETLAEIDAHVRRDAERAAARRRLPPAAAGGE